MHREGTAAAYDPPVTDILHGGTDEGFRAHADMPVKGTVLELDKCGDEFRGQRIARRKTPLPVVGNACAEQMSVAIGHDGRIDRILKQVARQAKEP